MWSLSSITDCGAGDTEEVCPTRLTFGHFADSHSHMHSDAFIYCCAVHTEVPLSGQVTTYWYSLWGNTHSAEYCMQRGATDRWAVGVHCAILQNLELIQYQVNTIPTILMPAPVLLTSFFSIIYSERAVCHNLWAQLILILSFSLIFVKKVVHMVLLFLSETCCQVDRVEWDRGTVDCDDHQ